MDSSYWYTPTMNRPILTEWAFCQPRDSRLILQESLISQILSQVYEAGTLDVSEVKGGLAVKGRLKSNSETELDEDVAHKLLALRLVSGQIIAITDRYNEIILDEMREKEENFREAIHRAAKENKAVKQAARDLAEAEEVADRSRKDPTKVIFETDLVSAKAVVRQNWAAFSA